MLLSGKICRFSHYFCPWLYYTPSLRSCHTLVVYWVFKDTKSQNLKGKVVIIYNLRTMYKIATFVIRDNILFHL